MLRPERMSQVSVTGAKAVMPTVIETLHDLELIHFEDYDGDWDGFDGGRSLAGADELSELLVTVRSIESILALDRGEFDPTADVPADPEPRIREIQEQVNALDDERSAVRSDLRTVEEQLEQLEPFVALDIDLELFRGYEHLEVAVGAADETAVRDAIEAADHLRGAEVFAAEDHVAVFAAPAEDGPADPINEALLGVEFTELEIPAGSGPPTERLAELDAQREDLQAELERIEAELADLRETAGAFLVAVEADLSVEVEKKEAPLRFATTERAFVAEGWVPSSAFDELATTLDKRVDGRIVVEELDQVDYDAVSSHGHGAADDAEHSGAEADSHPSMHGDDPPVVQNNPDPAKPFELLVNLVSRPRYSELDPTMAVFLTFPLAFGFMIGDIGYGLLYGLLGVALWRFDSDTMRSLGWIAVWAGVFTVLFGYLYGEFFGIHLKEVTLLKPISPALLGLGAFHKGLESIAWAQLWLIVAILFGILHLNVAFLIGFINDRSHGLRAAVSENLSWLVAMDGFFLWVFSTSEVRPFAPGGVEITAASVKPTFLVGAESVLAQFVGFQGLPGWLGAVGLIGLVGGIVLVGIGEGIEGLVESPAYIMGHSLSYLRMTAVLLAKGGMAFVVNVLVFGAYLDHGHVIFRLPSTDVAGLEAEFPGLLWMDYSLAVTIPAAILVFILGHLLVVLLGITAAGIQMTRLEWVEFFQKFYQGGGAAYEPYGGGRGAAIDGD